VADEEVSGHAHSCQRHPDPPPDGDGQNAESDGDPETPVEDPVEIGVLRVGIGLGIAGQPEACLARPEQVGHQAVETGWTAGGDLIEPGQLAHHPGWVMALAGSSHEQRRLVEPRPQLVVGGADQGGEARRYLGVHSAILPDAG